ncbi:Uncharacterized protein BM_BM208 [Brugia malayi]|uniref:Bm208 n=1 Tax=Brugia malayi TaxID=6279 RepID=A0A0R3REA0_BRUMA|nr:Uncharacterized protein BM_BM208 [Brugia malayi]CRZ22647.1 Bm208 [Brugia malayi]VIO99728.1 Uncharacterized protein BM_BM208 [Brugia malayi]
MFRCLSNYSKVIKLANVRSFPTYRLVAMNSTYEANKNDTSSKRNSINDGTKYVRIAAMLITALIGLRLITSVFVGKSHESFGDTFKSNAFSWPQHYNIFLSQDRLDVNNEDDEISTDDI